MWTILSGGIDPRDFAFHNSQERLYDTDAIRAGSLETQPQRWQMLLGRSR
jgi:cellulose synthase (UDP-forming)